MRAISLGESFLFLPFRERVEGSIKIITVKMTTGIIHDQNLEKHIEKQMGCMAGFLQIFDRHQILAGKRLYSTKRLPPSVLVSLSTILLAFPLFNMDLETRKWWF